MWDLDADNVFFDNPPPPPMGPAGPVGPESTPDETMRALTDSTTHRHGDSAPCAVCRPPFSLYVDGVCVHLACWKATDPPTATHPRSAGNTGADGQQVGAHRHVR